MLMLRALYLYVSDLWNSDWNEENNKTSKVEY